jgi:hypothetical protein
MLLGGCTARWHAQTGQGLATFRPACPGRRAPAVADFGAAGVRAVYNLVTDDVSSRELSGLLRDSGAQGFRIMPLTVNLNGHDTLFMTGPSVLNDQTAVDEEFQVACRLGRGHIYLTHVRYNPEDIRSPEIRVR